MQRIKFISSAALRFGCSYFGLYFNRLDKNEVVFVFRSLSHFAFSAWLYSNNIRHYITYKNGFYSVRVPFSLLHIYHPGKILFKNFYQFITGFYAFAAFGVHSQNWLVARYNHRKKQNSINTLSASSWGKKFLISNGVSK